MLDASGGAAACLLFKLRSVSGFQATTVVLPRVMLGPQLIMVLVYLWSRAYPTANVGFMGVVNFQARASR